LSLFTFTKINTVLALLALFKHLSAISRQVSFKCIKMLFGPVCCLWHSKILQSSEPHSLLFCDHRLK